MEVTALKLEVEKLQDLGYTKLQTDYIATNETVNTQTFPTDIKNGMGGVIDEGEIPVNGTDGIGTPDSQVTEDSKDEQDQVESSDKVSTDSDQLLLLLRGNDHN